MICKNCGAQLPDNSVFCGNCGSSVTNEQQTGGMPNPPMQQGGFNPGMPNQNPQGGMPQQPQQPQSFIPDSQPQPQQGFNPNMQQGGFIPNNQPQQGFNPNMQPGFDPNQPPKKKLDPKMIVIPSVAVVLVAAIVMVIVGVAGSGPDKTVDRFFKAMFKEDGKGMVAEISTGYKSVITKWAEAADMDGDLTKEAEKEDMTLKQYIDKTLEDSFNDMAKSFTESAENEVGRNPEFSYKITAEEHATKEQKEKFNKIAAIVSDSFKISDLALVDVTITASGKGKEKESEQDLTVFLSKESDGWKIIELEEDGTDFDDILDKFKAYSSSGASSLDGLFDGTF